MLGKEFLSRADHHFHPRILKCTLMHGGKPFFCDLHHFLVDLHEDDLLHGMVEGFAEGAAITSAHDEDLFRGGMGKERGMHEHLMIKKLVALGEHKPPVQGQDPAVAFRLRQV